MAKMKRALLAFYVILFISSAGLAQSIRLNISGKSVMTISGTSTLHDWTSEVDTIIGYVEVDKKMIDRGDPKRNDKIIAVHIEVPVKSIISPRGATMDKKTWNALKSEEHPKIIFDMKGGKITNINGSAFSVQAKGNLTIAGKTREVEFLVSGELTGPGKMKFTGSYKMNMRDYDVEPPSAMFGQIVTGEEVEVKFELVVVK